MRNFLGTLCMLTLPLSVFAQKADNGVLKQGLKFLDTPYVAHTLEVNDEETLVVNLKEVDCTTFVEYVLALALSPKGKDEKENADFTRNLRNIRYRDGIIKGYTSRLHYIADWVNNGEKQGFIEDIAAINSPDTIVLSLNFMSTHPELYKQLASSSENVDKMKETEKALTGQAFHYIPQNKLSEKGFPWIKNGDIIAITTDIPGLDVAHVGIAYYEKGIFKLLHASSTEKKVVITKNSLSEMLKANKKFTGIRVLRLKR